MGEIYAHDPDEGPNAVVHYSIKGNIFFLLTKSLIVKFVFLLYNIINIKNYLVIIVKITFKVTLT